MAKGAFANGNSYSVSLSDLGDALGLALPAANGSGDAKLRVTLSAAGQEDSYNWGTTELTVPERPAATDPGAEKRAHEMTDRSIQMLDAGMLAEYDFGVAVQADALPQEPALVDEDGDGLITGLAEDTEYCLCFRKKATDGAFRSLWFRSADVSARTNRSIPLAAGVETAEYTWMPDFALNIEDAIVFVRVEGGGEQAIPENAFALTITDENGAAVEGTITDAGTYTVNVALDCDNYVLAAGGDSFTITVHPLDLSGEDVVLSVEGPLTVGYTGASVYPQIGGGMLEVKVGGVDRGALPADCFTIAAAEGKNDVNAGDAYLTVVGQGNATGEAELAYTIIAKDIADAGVTVEPIGELVYTGAALEPSVTVKDGDKALVKDVDYAATYANNTAVGTATVTITGKGNYTGTRTANFAIAPKDIAGDEGFTIDPIPDQVYTGGEITPEIVVKDGDTVLTEGEDYEVTFEIVQKDIAGDEGFTIDPIPDQVYTGGEIEPEIVVKDGDTVLVEGEDYEVSFEENTDAGTVTVTITGTGNYAGEREVTFEIVKATAPAIEWRK